MLSFLSLALLNLLSRVCLVNVSAERLVVDHRSICGEGDVKYFEITLTTYHTEPITSLETFVFKSKVNSNGNSTHLQVDIESMCATYSIANCEDMGRLIRQKYNEYVDQQNNQAGECSTTPVIDFGYDEHIRQRKSLSHSTKEHSVQHASEVITVVSGYWNVANKHMMEDHVNPYEVWLHNTLRLHIPYVMFTDAAHVQLVRDCRRDLPTLLVLRNPSEFAVNNTYDSTWTHPEHVPSAALAAIWLEKINLMLLASQLTNATYYAWVDAGLGTYRNSPLPAEEWSLEVVLSLPITRMSYTWAQGTYHSFAGGIFIMHRDLIPVIHALFYQEYNICRDSLHNWHCGSEQYLLTLIRDKYPHLFHAMSYEYGDMSLLWANKYPLKKNKF